MDADATQKLTEKLNLLEQRLTREHSRLHGVKIASISNENSNEVNERLVRDIENRIEILENTILQKNCDKKIQSLEEIVQELSKQQAQYNERTEKLKALVSDQEKTIYVLREKVNKIQNIGYVYRYDFVSTKDENDRDENTSGDPHTQSEILQQFRSTAASSDLRDIVSSKSKNSYYVTLCSIILSIFVACVFKKN